MRVAGLGTLLLWVPSFVSAQQVQVVRGTVGDPGGSPLAGADVLLDARITSTNAQGAFRFDSVAPGSHYVTVRFAGYVPIRTRIEVDARTPTELQFRLTRAPFLLPPVITTLSRRGIYGNIGDTAHRPLRGVRVDVAGVNGGVVLTDSLGGFAFPSADRGTYLLRFTRPGYAERRLVLDLKPGEGRQVMLELSPSSARPSRADDQAFESLHQRLAFGLHRERMTGSELARYGHGGLCDVPRMAVELGGIQASTTVILNGVDVLLDFPVSALCTWRADEVSLVEFGKDICADVTHTAGDALAVPPWCAFRSRNVTRSASGATSIRAQGGGTSYVIIWEKR